MFKGKTRGKYLMLGCLAAGYLVVMLGSVHITYIWAFGPALVILSLLYADLALTPVTSIFTIAINFLYIPLFSTYSTEYADRINAVLTDAVFMILLSLMGIFYSRLNKKQNKESLDEIEEAARAGKISDNVDACVDATTKVMDAISNLSATSEEVAASAKSSIEISQDCKNDMSTTKGLLDDILKISRSGRK